MRDANAEDIITLDTIEPNEFLDAIFGDDPQCLVAKLKTTGGFYHTRRDDHAFKRWAGSGTIKVPWFFCCSTVRDALHPVKKYQRRQAVDAVAAHCLVLDDVGTKVVKAIPLEPSWKLESSPGNFQWGYILETPVTDQAEFTGTTKGLAEAEFTDGSSVDFVHVFRSPGSANQKPGRELFQSRISDWHPERKFTLAGIREAFGTKLVQTRQRKQHPPIADVDDVLDPLLTWMTAAGLVLRDQGDFVVVECPNAAKHTTGTTEAGYSPLGRSDLPMYRGFNCFHDHCDLKFKDWMAHCKVLGADVVNGFDPIPWLQQRYVILLADKPVVVDLKTRAQQKSEYPLTTASLLEDFIGTMKRDDGDTVTVMTVYKNHPDTVRCNDTTYDPTTDDPVLTSGDLTFLNEHYTLIHPETDQLPVRFLKHLEYLCGEHTEQVLNWLAFKLQNPDQRSYAIMMVTDGVFGVGRGILGKALMRVWGRQARPTDLPQILGIGSQNVYTDWMSKTQLAICDETKDSVTKEDSYHAYETFKQRIDTSTSEAGIKRKYKDEKIEKLWFNALIFSNHLDALVLPPEERRLMVIRNPDVPIGGDIGKETDEAIVTETAAIFWFLKRRDVSEFDNSTPPKTAAKAHMIDMSMSGRDEILEWLEDNVPGDIVTKPSFEYWFDKACDATKATEPTRKASFSRLWRRLPHVGRDAEKGVEIRFEGATKYRVRCLRNAAVWRKRYADEGVDPIKAEVERSEVRQGATDAPFKKP